MTGLLAVDTLELEVGYELVQIVEAGDLVERIRALAAVNQHLSSALDLDDLQPCAEGLVLRLRRSKTDPEGRGEGDAMVFINPEITVVGDEVAEGWEGCLSIPELYVDILRPNKVLVRGISLEGEEIEIEADEFILRGDSHAHGAVDGERQGVRHDEGEDEHGAHGDTEGGAPE